MTQSNCASNLKYFLFQVLSFMGKSHHFTEQLRDVNEGIVIGSGIAGVFPGGQAAHSEDQSEEQNEENLRKIKETMGNEEMFVSCSQESERLAKVLILRLLCVTVV